MTIKAKVEAVLFMTDKPIRAQAIARIVNSDVHVVRQHVLELISEYDERNGALMITQDNGYMIEVKDEYSSLMEEFLPIEMSAALLRTLSAIAIRQPVAQSEIIKIRGAGAYEHIKELINRELVSKREDGRSPTLNTTKRFQSYFRLTRDASVLRQTLRKQDRTLPSEDEEGQQLALPLSEEEKHKQEQVEAMLGQLLEVVSKQNAADGGAENNHADQDTVSRAPSFEANLNSFDSLAFSPDSMVMVESSFKIDG